MTTRIIIASALALELGCHAARADQIAPTLTLDQPVVEVGAGATVHLLVRFDVPEPVAVDPSAQPPVQLALVIDRSGSMREANKLTFAREAAKTMVSQLRPEDRLGIIEYDDRITVLWPTSPVSSPDLVHQLIDGLVPRGGTDIAGGLSAAIAETQRDRLASHACRVILLSDGQATVGATDPATIAAVAAAGRRSGIAVTTMGLGLSYDEDLMQGVADAGGGRYYYIENPAEMMRIYRAEMGKVLRQSTRDLAVWFDRGPAVSATPAVYGYPAETTAARTTIAMGDLYGGDARVVLIGLRLDQVAEGACEVGRLGLRYVDASNGIECASELPVVVRGTRDRDLATRSVDGVVATEAVLVISDERHEQAVRAFEAGDKSSALAAIDTLRADLAAAHAKFADPKLAKKLESLDLERADMDRAEQDLAYRAAYLKQSKEAFHGGKRGVRDKYLLDAGASGLGVEDLQCKLADLGHYAGPVDGRYGDAVRDAVLAFQRAQGLDADGIAGPRTLRALGLY